MDCYASIWNQLVLLCTAVLSEGIRGDNSYQYVRLIKGNAVPFRVANIKITITFLTIAINISVFTWCILSFETLLR